jgi:hypothetical protein
LRQIIFAIFLFLSPALSGQTNCAIGYIQGSNKIHYDGKEVEKIIDLSKYNAIFYGEGHIKDFEPEFKLNFIKHLNQRFEIRDVFMEIGYSAAYYFNSYLKTGDTTILNRNRLAYNSKSYRSFWYNLYLFNKSQPEKLKIIIHGVDFERTEVLTLLDELRKRDVPVPEYLKTTFNDITRLSKDTSLFAFTKTFSKEIEKIRTAFYKNQNDFKEIYGENFKIILAAINNKTPVTTKVKPRNKVWYKNINEIILENHIQKFVAFFGKAHTSYDNPTSLTVTLKDNKHFKSSILNILGVYHNFLSYGYMGDTPKIFDYEPHQKSIYEKYANINCRATLFSADKVDDFKIKKKADYVLFAKDIVVDK